MRDPTPYKVRAFSLDRRLSAVTNSAMLAAQMERPPTPKLNLAGAGSVLIGTTRQ